MNCPNSRSDPVSILALFPLWLDDFEGDTAANRLLLVGHIDDTTAALADLLKQFIAANPVADLLARQRRLACICHQRQGQGNTVSFPSPWNRSIWQRVWNS